MDSIQKYFILIIVVWRVTHLIALEDGPFDIIIKLRKAAGNSFFGKLMDCFYCLSIWIGSVAAIYTGESVQNIIVLTLYYSGASLLLEKVTNKDFN